MTQKEIKELMENFEIGTSMSVPMTTTLWMDTMAISNILTRDSETDFTLVTTFLEFWAGHGWSWEQKETEKRTLAEITAILVCYQLKDFKIQP